MDFQKQFVLKIATIIFLCISWINISETGYADSGKGCLCREFKWWDNFPRIVHTSVVAIAEDHHAHAAMYHAQSDPGWGLYGQKNSRRLDIMAGFNVAGIIIAFVNRTQVDQTFLIPYSYFEFKTWTIINKLCIVHHRMSANGTSYSEGYEIRDCFHGKRILVAN